MNECTISKNRTYFTNAIRREGKTLGEIAKELGTDVPAVRRSIRKVYDREVWANKLIGVAMANETKKIAKGNSTSSKVKSAANNPYKVVLVDTSGLTNFFEYVKKFETVIVPQMCKNELVSIIRKSDRLAEKEKCFYEEVLQYVESKAKVVYHKILPMVPRYMEGYKKRSITFARYAIWVRKVYFEDIKILTCSREVRELLDRLSRSKARLSKA